MYEEILFFAHKSQECFPSKDLYIATKIGKKSGFQIVAKDLALQNLPFSGLRFSVRCVTKDEINFFTVLSAPPCNQKRTQRATDIF